MAAAWLSAGLEQVAGPLDGRTDLDPFAYAYWPADGRFVELVDACLFDQPVSTTEQDGCGGQTHFGSSSSDRVELDPYTSGGSGPMTDIDLAMAPSGLT